MTRLTGAVATPTGGPIEGLQLAFLPVGGGVPVTALTDASGDYRVDLPPGVAYRLALPTPIRLNGSTYTYPVGVMFRVTAPAYGPVAMLDEAPDGLVTLLDMIAALEVRIEALESPLRGGGTAAGHALADAAGEVT